MKKLILIVVIFLVFVVGYLAGSFFPVSGFSFIPQKSILGQAKLEVKLTMDNGTPLNNVEVDLGEKPGPPAKGGVAITDENGIATFNVKAGSYVIYFNNGTFPQNLAMPELIQVVVDEGMVNEKTIILKTK